MNGWLGEIPGLQVSLIKANEKLAAPTAAWNGHAATARADPPTSACPSAPDRDDGSTQARACRLGGVMREIPARRRRLLSGSNRQGHEH